PLPLEFAGLEGGGVLTVAVGAGLEGLVSAGGAAAAVFSGLGAAGGGASAAFISPAESSLRSHSGAGAFGATPISSAFLEKPSISTWTVHTPSASSGKA